MYYYSVLHAFAGRKSVFLLVERPTLWYIVSMNNDIGPEAPAVVFDNVSVSLSGVSILHKVSATVPADSSTAIIGPNGAGKTTLLNVLLGEVAHSGVIRVNLASGGEALRIGYVPQRLDFDRGLPLSVMDFMLLGRQRGPLWLGRSARLMSEIKEHLAAVKADSLAERSIGALSGGEMQRVMLALAIQQQPHLLILDEPASGVDFEGEQMICEFLDRLRASYGFTQLMVSHDLGTVSHHAEHVICLNKTVVAEGPPKQVFTRENLAAVYGIHMGVLDSAFMPSTRRGGGGCEHD